MIVSQFFEYDSPPSTAIYPNRLLDKKNVEETFALSEYPVGDVCFYTPNGNVFSKRYIRVVYGDHGPYVEFDPEMVIVGLTKKFPNSVPSPDMYYEWLIPSDGSDLKVYNQKRTVENLKNPPIGGFRGNRSEGYADYKVGMIYVNPFDFGKIDVILD